MEGKKGKLSLLGSSQGIWGTSGKGSWNKGEVKVGKDWTEEWQGLGCREDEDREVREG